MHPSRRIYVDAEDEARPLFALLELLARWPSVTLEVLFRRRFGERYLTVPLLLAAGLSAHGLLRLFAGLEPWGWSGASTGSRLFLAAFLGLSLGQVYELRRRRRQGERWHSYSDGVSLRIWNRLTRRPEIVQGVLEPLAAALGGAALLPIDRPLGLYLLFASGVWSYKQSRVARRRRSLWLDRLDGVLERRHLREAWLLGRPPQETAGVVVPRDPGTSDRALEKVIDELLEEAEKPNAPLGGGPDEETTSADPVSWAERFRAGLGRRSGLRRLRARRRAV